MDKKTYLLVAGNSIAVIATIIVNALAVILPINGKSTSELSDALPNLFVPAGLTFSIWSIIYLFLILFMIYQILTVMKTIEADATYINTIGGWFMLASLANILWIFLWHYQYVSFSLLAMILLFFSLLACYMKLKIGISSVALKEKLMVHVPISIYLGWITVATIANVTAVLVDSGVGELLLGQEMWTIAVIIVAALITILVLVRRSDLAYSLVIIWALLGIMLKRLAADPVYLTIVWTAAAAIIIIALTLIIKTLPFLKKTTQHST